MRVGERVVEGRAQGAEQRESRHGLDQDRRPGDKRRHPARQLSECDGSPQGRRYHPLTCNAT